jgi:hypothetical protein
MARPQINIDAAQFEKLCKLQCTLAEIAAWFSCSEDTIQRWCKRTYGEHFSDVYARIAPAGLISLRRNQFKLAEKNAAMAIFLGKNYLGQTDSRYIGPAEPAKDNNLVQTIREAIAAADFEGVDES